MEITVISGSAFKEIHGCIGCDTCINKGVLSAINSWQRADIEASDYPRQAYELGKNFYLG